MVGGGGHSGEDDECGDGGEGGSDGGSCSDSIDGDNVTEQIVNGIMIICIRVVLEDFCGVWPRWGC